MCKKEMPNTYTWRCGHTVPEGNIILHWCDMASVRGSPCPNPEQASKASSRGYAKRNVCPNCRNKDPSNGRDDDDITGAGGSGSSAAQFHGVIVGA